MIFEIVSGPTDIEVVAVNLSIRERARLIEDYGGKRWRKLKGSAVVRLRGGRVRRVELHWYEAHGVGRRKMKIKRYLD